MAELINKSKRQLIPRWHTSRKLDFFRPFILPDEEGSHDFNLELFRIDEKKIKWEETQTISSAIELFVGLKQANITNVAIYNKVKGFLQSNQHNLNNTVNSILTPTLRKLDVSNSYTTNRESIYKIISNLKSFVSACPYDSLTWNDLAFYYAVLGEEVKAKHCMHIAYNLQTKHPFLARSYARLLVHYDEPDKAVHILKKTGVVKKHPEILSADVAIRTAFDIGSPDIAAGRRLIDKYSAHPHIVSELSASIGTLEIENGSLKKGKILLTTSALAPTENTIAQLKWIFQQHKIAIPINDNSIRSLEANAISYYNTGEYLKCRDELMVLHRFQPFSEGALVDAGYISMIALDDSAFLCNFSEYFGDNVLVSFSARNNYIIARLQEGLLDGIDEMLRDLGAIAKDDREKAVFSAAVGMYLYLVGEVEEAKKKYTSTNEFFKSIKNHFSHALSLLYQGMIERKLGLVGATMILGQANKVAKKSVKSPELLDKIKREIDLLNKNRNDKG